MAVSGAVLSIRWGKGDVMKKSDISFYIDNGYFESPRELQNEITNRCSLSCPQCYKPDLQQRDMDIAVFLRVVDEAQKLGIRTLVLF